MCVCAYVRVRMRVCANVYVRMCECVCVYVCMYVCDCSFEYGCVFEPDLRLNVYLIVSMWDFVCAHMFYAFNCFVCLCFYV